eukprot:TRINITY_DN13632_c0_g1_i16.p2 TRINITY_DN13632_c0_g1~~TRINITY_DN13632_c0_g1_i16.p2  ORF type:complete len:268 (+),score=54.89 TRINITY_DN13632_c0_g1_i16:62-805(+)
MCIRDRCRDENAFRCHTVSDTHQRQMRLFAENPDKYINEYSRMFEENFLEVLRRKYPSKKVLVNKAYNDYIANRFHVHMNSTRWTTLTSFVEHLHSHEKVEVEKTEKGTYIKLVDKRPDALTKKVAVEKRMKSEAKAQLKEQQKILQHAERTLQSADADDEGNKEAEPSQNPDQSTELDLSKVGNIAIEFKGLSMGSKNQAVSKVPLKPPKKDESTLPLLSININPNQHRIEKVDLLGKRKATDRES